MKGADDISLIVVVDVAYTEESEEYDEASGRDRDRIVPV